MIDNQTITDHLEKILGSSGFSKSKRYTELLRYLVQSEMEGKTVKETTIAIDLFQKDDSFDPTEDTIVRVSIGNLRKKLATYYFTEGVSDTLRIEIPKGGYRVVFKTVKPKKYERWNLRNRPVFAIPLFLAIISILGVIFLLFQNKNLKTDLYPVTKNNPIWYEYTHSGIPNMLVIGDYFFMYEMHEKENRRVFIRDSRINNLEEYEENSPNFYSDWLPLEFTYLRKGVAISSLTVVPILKMSDQEVLIKQSSELLWEDFDMSNLVYTGTIKGFNILEKLLPDFHIQVQRDSVYQIQRLDESGEVAETYGLPRSDQDSRMTDFAYIGKIRGPGNHSVMIIASGDEVGLVNAVELVTSSDFEDYVHEKYPDVIFEPPFYFEMVIKTVGFRRTGFTNEIVYFEQRSE
jgi:hypothetical protein